MKSVIIALPALAALVAAKTVEITVGPGLEFSPNDVQAAQGDVLAFKFANTEHDVVQGDFSNACHPLSDTAVFSGMPKNAGDVFSVTVNSTDPMYFYCGVQGHCQGGMVMAVNAPSSGNTLDAYKSAAASASDSSQPSNVEGGTYGSASSSSTTMSGSASMTGSATGTASPSSTSNAAGMVGMSFAGAAAGLAAFLL